MAGARIAEVEEVRIGQGLLSLSPHPLFLSRSQTSALTHVQLSLSLSLSLSLTHTHSLQTQLNILFNTAKRLDLIVNLDKSNIVVFRNGGHLALNEKWYFGNEKLEVVNMYKYLGVYFTTRLTFSPTLNDLADLSQKGNASNYETFMVHW